MPPLFIRKDEQTLLFIQVKNVIQSMIGTMFPDSESAPSFTLPSPIGPSYPSFPTSKPLASGDPKRHSFPFPCQLCCPASLLGRVVKLSARTGDALER